jgi:rod shape-determining protein MreC
MVKPAAHLDRLDEVMVITSTQPRFNNQEQKDVDTSEAEKGADAQAIKDQLKASQIMAEHLPGLINPNLPPDQQPLNDSSDPPLPKAPPQPLHPDRFTPGSAVTPAAEDTSEPAASAQPRTAEPGKTRPEQAKPKRAKPNQRKPATGTPPQGNR